MTALVRAILQCSAWRAWAASSLHLHSSLSCWSGRDCKNVLVVLAGVAGRQHSYGAGGDGGCGGDRFDMIDSCCAVPQCCTTVQNSAAVLYHSALQSTCRLPVCVLCRLPAAGVPLLPACVCDPAACLHVLALSVAANREGALCLSCGEMGHTAIDQSCR